MSEREPITTELRAALDVDREFMRADGAVVAQTFCIDRGDFERCCDAIDAVHAGLERENAKLRERVAVLDNGRGNMHDGWSITGELREWASVEVPYKYGHQLTAIADRIDAEHESACAEAYGNGVMSVPIALDESAWVKLPVDADGEVIHVGDVMKTERFGVVEVEGFIHNAIAFNVYDPQPARICTVPANQCRHYHAPTVEDVLTKFGIDWEYEDNCEDRAALLAEYAAKLRLAGSDAE